MPEVVIDDYGSVHDWHREASHKKYWDQLVCDNDHVVRIVTDPNPMAIHNIYSTTAMPVAFRWLLVGLMVANLVVICAWNYFVVNRVRIGRKGVDSTREDAPLTEGQPKV